MEIYIDFLEIGDYEDFYAQLKEKLTLPEHFGDNLDALFDVITGELEMPLTPRICKYECRTIRNFRRFVNNFRRC
jgi:RNAse (barnase) inhibitor barstar